MEVMVVGSLRRGQQGSHDLDVCVRKPGVDDIFRRVKKHDAKGLVGFKSLLDDLLELLHAETLPSGESFLVVAQHTYHECLPIIAFNVYEPDC
jgi:hypothetical protein